MNDTTLKEIYNDIKGKYVEAKPRTRKPFLPYISNTKNNFISIDSEIWRDIPDYEDHYQVSNLGNVKSLSRYVFKNGGKFITKEKLLSKGCDAGGYHHVGLCKNGKMKTIKVHRLVAICFIDNPNNYKPVNHLDGNKQNNRVGNLEWNSDKQNVRHACHKGLRNKSYTNEQLATRPNNKPILQLSPNGELIKQWHSAKEVERELKLYAQHIYKCLKNKCETAYGYKWIYV